MRSWLGCASSIARGRRHLRLGRTPKLVALGYAVLGLCASANQKHEVFPFFSWFLFPVTPNRVTHYELSPRPTLSSLGRTHQMDLHVLQQELGAALERGDTVTTSTMLSRLKRNFLACPSRFAVVRTEYEPTARWSTGAVYSSRTIAEFTCRDEP